MATCVGVLLIPDLDAYQEGIPIETSSQCGTTRAFFHLQSEINSLVPGRFECNFRCVSDLVIDIWDY